MFDLLEKTVLALQKPKVIVVTGEEKAGTASAIYQVLQPHFKIAKNLSAKDILSKEVLILEQGSDFALKRSKLPILVITSLAETEKIIKTLPASGYLVLNSDKKGARALKKTSNVTCLTFGLNEEANFRATNISINSRINFKLNYKGNVVPVWLKGTDEKQIQYAMAAAVVATILGLNMVEISSALK